MIISEPGRYSWEFPYTRDQLLEAANQKWRHYQSRLDWWDAKKREVFETIKSKGVVIDESVAEMVSNSYGRDPTAKIDPGLQNDLRECVVKVKEHRSNVESYAGWIQILNAAPASQSYPLRHADWLFFFGQVATTGAES